MPTLLACACVPFSSIVLPCRRLASFDIHVNPTHPSHIPHTHTHTHTRPGRVLHRRGAVAPPAQHQASPTALLTIPHPPPLPCPVPHAPRPAPRAPPHHLCGQLDKIACDHHSLLEAMEQVRLQRQWQRPWPLWWWTGLALARLSNSPPIRSHPAPRPPLLRLWSRAAMHLRGQERRRHLPAQVRPYLAPSQTLSRPISSFLAPNLQPS